MIALTPAQIEELKRAAEKAYPEECCGLLLGRGADDVEVTRVVASPNVAADESGAPRRRDRFEVDPELRVALMRETEGTALRIVGHYHSHPDHPPAPSARDLESALEPEFIWLIVGVEKGRAGPVTAHVFEPGARAFREIALVIRA